MACASAVSSGATPVATSSSSLSAVAVTPSNTSTDMFSPFASHNPRPFERHSLQIHTKSIEQTLIPLVTQVGKFKAIYRVGYYMQGNFVIVIGTSECHGWCNSFIIKEPICLPSFKLQCPSRSRSRSVICQVGRTLAFPPIFSVSLNYMSRGST